MSHSDRERDVYSRHREVSERVEGGRSGRYVMGGGREEVGKGKKAGRRERRVKKRVQGGRVR